MNELLCGGDEAKTSAVAALRNQHREIYGVLNRRKYVIELRTRVNFKELENDAEDEEILAEIESKCKDFRSGYADMADQDPHVRRWVGAFRRKTDRASFTAAYKAAGKAKASKRNSKPTAPRRRPGTNKPAKKAEGAP